MDARMTTLAQTCFEAAETGAMTFPQIVGALSGGGFEGYVVDYRRATTTYYAADGDRVELPGPETDGDVAPRLDAEALGAAIRDAQTLASGYTYLGFCRTAKAAGCAGYMVSFTGRRALYFGRDAATHVEPFPN
ncbi:MAG: DUF1398 domain-containing protein [Phenylobacterium sp.]|nr:DUF1398 domain-containing protein [Phenylobacterium sp.]